MEAVFTAALEKRDHPLVRLPSGSAAKSSTVRDCGSCSLCCEAGLGVEPKPVYFPP